MRCMPPLLLLMPLLLLRRRRILLPGGNLLTLPMPLLLLTVAVKQHILGMMVLSLHAWLRLRWLQPAHRARRRTASMGT